MDRARRLRRDLTDAEQKLWARLRARQVNGAKFRRQHPIGRYIADFCCPERRLVMELDGGQHAMRAEADQRRTAFLVQQGYRVLRFWDNDVLVNPNAVMEEISKALYDPHPSPLPARERGALVNGSSLASSPFSSRPSGGRGEGKEKSE